MKSDFIEPADPRWAEFLERTPHDVYQLPAYLELAARHEGGRATAFYAEEAGAALLLPLLLRGVPEELMGPERDVCGHGDPVSAPTADAASGGAPIGDAPFGDAPTGDTVTRRLLDAVSPYGYPGILLAGPGAGERVAPFLEAFRLRARARGIITAFLRLHPFLGPPCERLGSGGTALRHGEVVFVDLTRTPEELWREVRASHRTRINRLRRAGFEVQFDAQLDEEGSYDAFPALYRATMARVGATDFYHFSDAYFRDLRAALGERLSLHLVRAPAGEVAAAGLFTATGEIVQYHLGATAAAYLKDAPTKLLFHEVISWARGRGYRILNLGGGVGGEADSLFHFKAGFSGSRAEYHTFRMVLDQEAYDHLLRRWVAQHGGGVAPPPGYFPGYRSGVSVPERRPSHV